MNHEIHHHSKFITTIGWVLILLFVYLFIVLLNFTLSRIERYTPIITKAQQIENLRYKQEDIPQIKTAKYNGYMRLMLPNILDDISAKPIVNGLISKTNIGLIGGQPYTKVFFCNEGYGLIKYKTDRFGLRNNDILWDKLDTLDILIIGDSFAQGACVNDISTISGVLLAKGHPAINTGTASNGPQNYAFLSKVFIKAVKPKYVVNILYTNDSYSEKIKENVVNGIYYRLATTRIDLSKYWKIDGTSLSPSPEYISANKQYHQALMNSLKSNNNKQNFYDKIRKTNYWLLKHTRDLLKQGIKRLTDKLFGSKLDILSKLAIDVTINNCKIISCHPIFVYIPNSKFYRPDPYATQYRNNLKKYLRKRKEVLLDATNELNKLGHKAYAIKGQHLSPSGYEAISQLIIREISKK